MEVQKIYPLRLLFNLDKGNLAELSGKKVDIGRAQILVPILAQNKGNRPADLPAIALRDAKDRIYLQTEFFSATDAWRAGTSLNPEAYALYVAVFDAPVGQPYSLLVPESPQTRPPADRAPIADKDQEVRDLLAKELIKSNQDYAAELARAIRR